MELMTDYGQVDILWLDGGWVKKRNEEMIRDYYHDNVDISNGFLKSTSVNQDIRMDELVTKARKKQPGLIVVDRAVEGKNQNYLTPENTVPEASLPFPWESCIISGGGWSHTPNATYKSPREVIHMLADIVCKGGNLLLNFAPGPDGTLQDDAYALMEAIGDWMDINSESIYGTRAIYPFKESKICFAEKKDGSAVFATYLSDEDETDLPKYIQIDAFTSKEDCSISLLGSDEKINWEKNGKGIHIEIPKKVRDSPPGEHAWVLKMDGVKPANK